jgi:hypothetical protein
VVPAYLIDFPTLSAACPAVTKPETPFLFTRYPNDAAPPEKVISDPAATLTSSLTGP